MHLPQLINNRISTTEHGKGRKDSTVGKEFGRGKTKYGSTIEDTFVSTPVDLWSIKAPTLGRNQY